MKKILYLSALLYILSPSSQIFASGFGIFSQSAASLGQAGSSIAHANSPSSVFYNPALINNLEGTQIELGTTVVQLQFEYENTVTKASAKTDDSLFFPSTFYATHKLNQDLSIGLGIFSPFGLATKWDESWEGRYLATTSELSSICVNPAISYRITPQMTLAAGINFIYLDASLENSICFAPYNLTDGQQKFSGDGSSYGFNLGMLYRFTNKLSLGLSYRSGYSIDLDGDVAFDLPQKNPAMLALLQIRMPNSGAKTTLDLPDVAFAGIAYKLTDKWTVETGILWEGWSDYSTINTTFDQPINGMTTNSIEKNWKDTLTTNIGVEYRYNDQITLRTGYLYRENAVSDNTFDPSLPDADAHLFALGGDILLQRYTLSVAYVYEKQKNRNKNNPLGNDLGGNANGTYSSDIHFLAVSLNLHF